MPQGQLPMFPAEITLINNNIGFQEKDGIVYYFHGHLPLFQHAKSDKQFFYFIISQIYLSGVAKQSEIVKAFGITKISVKRCVKKLRTNGIDEFFKPRAKRSPHVLTSEAIKKIQKLLDEGNPVPAISKRLGFKADTIRKAIKKGILKEQNPTGDVVTTKSERSYDDSQSEMGVGCTRTPERVAAAFGDLNGAQPEFKANADVRSAGVLLSLPGLIANGLLAYCNEKFSLSKGFYSLNSIILTLGLMALLRLKSIENVRYWDPGELGKLIGLDRAPEVRTIREKLDYICAHGKVKEWCSEMGKFWMEEDKDLVGTLYVDGHVRVYHGSQTLLPKRYVSREKLCLRGVTDYWINDATGKPFFVVHETINSGLIKELREQIVPRLMEEVPGQPTEKELEANPLLCRFSMVTDREGYSPLFFSEMWDKRIACYTYRKYAKENWPECEFHEHHVTFPNGEAASMKLAERGVRLGKVIWVREIRKLTDSGHQTAIVTTDYLSDLCRISSAMFSRWSQENFFKYMMEHFGINRLIEYEVEKMDDTIKVRNPRYSGCSIFLLKKRGNLLKINEFQKLNSVYT